MLAPLYHNKSNGLGGLHRKKLSCNDAKKQLMSSALLVLYVPNKGLVLSYDLSPCVVGAVQSHNMEDGSEKPTALNLDL